MGAAYSHEGFVTDCHVIMILSNGFDAVHNPMPEGVEQPLLGLSRNDQWGLEVE